MCGQSVKCGIFGAQNSCAVVGAQLHRNNIVNLPGFPNRKAESFNRKANIGNQKAEIRILAP